MKIFTFLSAAEAHDFGYGKNIPFTRMRDLHELSSREIHGLRIRKEWVMGIEFEFRYQNDESSTWYKGKCEFLTLDGFRRATNGFLTKNKVRLLSFYCYQLEDSPECVIHLENLKHAPLDKQLMDYTGDGFGMSSFHNEGEENRLSPGGVIVHKKTGLRFFVSSGVLDEVI